MGIETLIWLFLVAFMIHEFEEIIYLTPWTKKNLNKILDRAPNFFNDWMKKIWCSLYSYFYVFNFSGMNYLLV